MKIITEYTKKRLLYIEIREKKAISRMKKRQTMKEKESGNNRKRELDKG